MGITVTDVMPALGDIDATDIFCGAGGSSSGLAAAGIRIKLAANHWTRAVETHSANFPRTDHLCADVSNYDMRRLPRTAILWASPICTELSPAGGRLRRQAADQTELELFGAVAKEGLERTRATFHDVIRATEVHRYRAVLVENVVEAAEWELFDWWVEGMCRLGYRVQYVSVSSAHIGGTDNAPAPQLRDRLYLVFTQLKLRAPDVEPRPLAWCPHCDDNVRAVQSWKKPGRRIGKYRAQYVYRCPNGSRCRHAVVEPYVRPAASIINWADLGTRIGDRARPLKPKTLARIQAGLERFAQPLSGETASVRFAHSPGGHALRPVMVSLNHSAGAGTADGARAYPPEQAPPPSRTTKIGDGIATPPFIAELRNHCTATPVSDPLSTVTASGNHHGLCTPAPGSFYVRNFGNNRPENLVHSTDEPLRVVTAHDHQALVVPYHRTGAAQTTADPLDTLTSRDRFELLDADVTIEDCYFRMLDPHEQMLAQRFPADYIMTGNKGERTRQAGNAVSSNVAQWLGTQVVDILS